MLEVEDYGTVLADAAKKGNVQGILETLIPSLGFEKKEVNMNLSGTFFSDSLHLGFRRFK